MTYRYAIVVPHYNHAALFEKLAPRLLDTGLPLIVVDDGSDAEQRQAIVALGKNLGFHVALHEENQGKGGAVMTGLRVALDRGYSHALQVDADGQHDLGDIGTLLATSAEAPEAMICGRPVFGDDIPASRRWGRKLTNGLVVLETWSRQVPDAMCGFRVYPLARVVPLLDRHRPGRRMDFDVEVLVLASWAGLPMRFVPTRVVYPEDGVSHFHYLRDNVVMTLAHTRLVIGMLLRSPMLAWRRLRGQP
ncbi:glycosyltransferase family 2 protein [Marinihelvus fidelis]|uniref:Glycosyltransferase family 2 protein n=1 Tax=Marinihelvus fidelis TaxID=2613842 RepID=A0A5N0TBD8_9GAMM|nr:glycosyltransferase family 2 protein [Marinihelvus fidelis]KAA9131397.1 glycosyltransferase family 2 protein [Marinihelvus fidelis]